MRRNGDMRVQAPVAVTALTDAMIAIDAVWREQSKSPYIAMQLGDRVHAFPSLSEAAAERRSALGRDLLARIDAVDAAALPRDLAISLTVARTQAARWAREADWYWLLMDPAGVGFYCLFGPTAYGGGYLLGLLPQALRGAPFAEAADIDRYCALVEDYARLVREMHARTTGQAARGIRMPKPQVVQAVELLRRLRAAALPTLSVAEARLAAVGGAAAAARIQARIEAVVLPALDAFLAEVSATDYLDRAPDTVGIAQYPRGREIYAELVRLHTTTDLTPEAVHAKGLERMGRIRAAMGDLFARIGFAGTPREYLDRIAADPAWRATGEEAIAAFFRRYIDRIAPRIDSFFDFKPSAGHDVEPLPAAQAGSMTFGYYAPPNPVEPLGKYRFNAGNLAGNPLCGIGALNYHELVPGHHFHIASQNENRHLHPLRKFTNFNAFNEAWAEYAATLAGEMGMYPAPEEEFGRYMMDAFLTCRLIVDTGMNVLGWTLEQARDYMRANAFMPETEIRTESIRYSCDIPAQSLAYKLGDEALLAIREDMRTALGDRFDIRAFHNAVLKPGSLPLDLVRANVQAATAEMLAST